MFTPLKRVRYIAGHLPTIDDLGAEQRYVVERAKRHNRLFHGSGIVAGLAVSVGGGDDHEPRIRVEPGVALDGYGNEIIVDTAQEMPLPVPTTTPQQLVLLYDEVETDRLPPAGGEETGEASRIAEAFRLAYRPATVSGDVAGCDAVPGVVIATLQFRGDGWEVAAPPMGDT